MVFSQAFYFRLQEMFHSEFANFEKSPSNEFSRPINGCNRNYVVGNQFLSELFGLLNIKMLVSNCLNLIE